jgi:hypothetical protein
VERIGAKLVRQVHRAVPKRLFNRGMVPRVMLLCADSPFTSCRTPDCAIEALPL